MIGMLDLSTIRSNREHSVYDRSVSFVYNTVLIENILSMICLFDFPTIPLL